MAQFIIRGIEASEALIISNRSTYGWSSTQISIPKQVHEGTIVKSLQKLLMKSKDEATIVKSL